MTTIFRCSRCGYENGTLALFKNHLRRKTDCKPNISDISFEEVKKQYAATLNETSEKRLKRKLRCFGEELKYHIKMDNLKKYIEDPLRGIQSIIKEIYFNKEHEENHTVRSVPDQKDAVEIHLADGWTRKSKKRIFDKMIYFASDLLEYNIPKKYWTDEFRNFIYSMGEVDNEELILLIREELEDTFTNALSSATN